MKNLILNIAILTVVMILANNFTTSAQTAKGNKATTSITKSADSSKAATSTEAPKTVKENNTKENNNNTATEKTNKTKTVKKHTFFLHLNNIALGNGQFA